jgi:hypothetical protein
MSENIKPFSLAAAQKYNSKTDFKLFDAMLEAVICTALGTSAPASKKYKACVFTGAG